MAPITRQPITRQRAALRAPGEPGTITRDMLFSPREGRAPPDTPFRLPAPLV